MGAICENFSVKKYIYKKCNEGKQVAIVLIVNAKTIEAK